MTATTIKSTEDEPASRPDIIVRTHFPDPELRAAVWQRLEQWIAWRWGERDCVFLVEGPGNWSPPLHPFNTLTIEVWDVDQWVTAVVPPTPEGGYCLDLIGPFRFTGTLGTADDPPAIVIEAFRRLARYFIETHNSHATDGALRSINLPEKLSVDLQTSWSAKALQYSGAADLLRPYRNLGAN